MDPKQTEGQNSGSGTLSTGANISRTMDALNVNERKSATSNSPFAKHHFDKIAPGTGDILIDPSAGSIISSAPAENKGINRGRLIQFGLIFGGIALIGLVIFTVVMLVNQPKKTTPTSGGNANSIVTRDPKEAFEDFLEVLINGQLGKSTFTASDGKNYSFLEVLQASSGLAQTAVMYADTVINYDTSDGRSVYLDDLISTIEIFSSNYSGDNEVLVDQVSHYYRDFAKITPVTDESIVAIYNRIGYDEAKKYVENIYGFNDDREINDYNSYSREYAMAAINLLNEAKEKQSCEITNLESVKACTALSTLGTYQTYVETSNAYLSTASQIKQNARRNAMSAIGQLYLEYNDVNGENE